MAATAKVSVAIGKSELDWAKARAKREHKSLSAIVTETMASQRRLEALREVVEWMQAEQSPLEPRELKEAARELKSRKR